MELFQRSFCRSLNLLEPIGEREFLKVKSSLLVSEFDIETLDRFV